MTSFKSGDKVRRTEPTLSNKLLKGSIYTVSRYTSGGCNGGALYLQEESGSWHANKFELTTLEEKKSTDTKWSFNVHLLGEIDKDLIYQDLSSNNPVALVETSTGKCSTLYHKSLLDKAHSLGMKLLDVQRVEDFSEAVRLAKEVKNAPWGTTKKKVTVSLPTI